MTKEQLKKYRVLKAELNDLESDINSKILHNSVEDYNLLLHESDLKMQIIEIESFVSGINDYNLKKAIIIYYINEIEDGEDKPTWEDVADEIKNGYNGDSIRKKVEREILKNI